MKFKISSGGVPAGSYLAEFLGAEPYENEANDYPPGLRWEWQITQDAFKGQKVSRVTGANPSMKNACGKMIAALSGKPLVAGDEVDIDSCKGKQYLVIVAAGESGATRVEHCTTPPLG